MPAEMLARTFVRLSTLLLLCLNVAAVIPGGSYFGQHSAGLYNNCTGSATSGPPNLAAATAPQIGPISPGWELWTYFLLLGDGSMTFLRWYKGNPASPSVNPWNATFELVTVYPNSTQFHTAITEQTLHFTEENGVYELSIAGNTLIWDDEAVVFNISLNVNGITGGFMTTSIVPYPLTPAADHVVGQLAPDLFSTVSVVRGHSNTGYINYPSGQVEVLGISSLRHTFSVQPIQNVITMYSSGSTWTAAAVWDDTVTYYTAQPLDGSLVEVGSYARAVETADDILVDMVYSVTNQPEIMSFAWDLPNETLSFEFPGCSLTQGIPYLWYSSVFNHLTSFVDSAGGVTAYYNVTVNSTVPVDGVASVAYGIGVWEVYHSNNSQEGM